MADPVDDQRTGPVDRRAPEPAKPSAWSDPKLWVSIFGLLLVLGSALLHKVNEIDDHVVALTLATGIKDQARDDAIKGLKERQDEHGKQINNNADMQMAYNTSVLKALTEMITTMKLAKLPTPELPDPPKLKNATP